MLHGRSPKASSVHVGVPWMACLERIDPTDWCWSWFRRIVRGARDRLDEARALRFNGMGLTKKGLHLSMFRFRGTTLCIGEDADCRDSLPLATGVRDWRSWTARGVCIGNLTDPSTSRCWALAWRRLGGRKIEQGESRSASRVMFHTKVRCSGHVRPTFIGWALPVRQPFFVSPNGIVPAIGDTGKARNRVRCQLVRVRADR